MNSIRKLEKLPHIELSSLVLKLKLRGFREANESEAPDLPVKHFSCRQLEDLVQDFDNTKYWVIVWNEPLIE